MLFQDKLKQLRKEKNISQYDLSNDLHISRSVIAKWETGLTLPNEESILLLTNYFNVSREELLNDNETEKIVVNKNISISKMKKIIISLTCSLLIVIIALVIVASIGFRNEDNVGNPPIEEDKYTLVVNNESYAFEPYLKKSENDANQKCFFINVDLDRKDIIHIYEKGEQLANTIIIWDFKNNSGTTESSGGFYLWEEGNYDIYLTESYYESVLTNITITAEFADTTYNDVGLYFVDNIKESIKMTRITKESNTIFTQFINDWYIEDITLEEGSKIYFFATLNTNQAKQITGFKSDYRFEEIYDEEFNAYYIKVKQTCNLNYLLLTNENGLMTLRYSE